MRVTVAVCTWNRSQLLQQSLEHMTHLIIPPALDWELLIVNNACSDGTDRVIAAFFPRLPLRRLFEPNPGLSHARNLAVREASGEYIVWTDDDALVDETWLAGYVEAFHRWPDAVFFGGPVRPHFAFPPPAWLARAWPVPAHAYAMRDFGDQPLLLTGGNCIPFGANYAVRMSEQRRHPYDPNLGHRQKRRIGGEETRLVRELLAEGRDGRWVPGAAVRHYIPLERMTTGYIRTYYGGHGWSLVLPGSTGAERFRLLRIPWRICSALIREASYRWHRVLSPPAVWMRHLIRASKAWGRLLGSLGARPPAFENRVALHEHSEPVRPEPGRHRS
jgi:glycosyltransferase involved in cell wall biosynthesis